MLLPKDRYEFSSKKRGKKNQFKPVLAILFFVVIVAGTILFITNKETIIKKEKPFEEIAREYWRAQKYSELMRITEEMLREEPVNPAALVFHGFSAFYQSTREYSLENKLPYLDKAVLSLRKALLLNAVPLEEGVYYVLGKSYYHKGKFYSDLAVKYLEKSIQLGYESEDTFEYLGLANSNLEKYEEAAEYFSTASEKNPNDILFLTLAQTYEKMGRDEDVEENLLRAINITNDVSIEEKSRYILANLFMKKGEFLKAEEQYHKIIGKNENAADAHFHLGEIYNRMSDTVKARAEWRTALRIDPSHYGAKLNLYN